MIARRRWTPALAVGLTMLSLGMFVAMIVLSLLTPATKGRAAIGSALTQAPLLAFAIVGGLLAAKRPANRVGWICLAAGVGWSLAFFDNALVDYGKAVVHHAPPLSDWLQLTGWVLPAGLLATFLLLYFPDGRLPSPRWRIVAWTSGFMIVVLTFVTALSRDDDGAFPDIPNLFTRFRPLAAALSPLIVLFPVCFLLCAASLFVRFRRAGYEEREKLKWIAFAGAIVAGIYTITFAFSINSDWGGSNVPPLIGALQTISLMAFGLIPVSVGFAILRHRLYDIDRIISRTVSYALVSLMLVGIYLSIVLLGAGAIGSRKGHPSWVIAVGTLAAAFLFAPLRRRVQAAVDRRFNRRRYDAMRTVDDFVSTLRAKVDLDDVRSSLTQVVATTLSPSSVSMWIARPSSSGSSRAPAASG